MSAEMTHPIRDPNDSAESTDSKRFTLGEETVTSWARRHWMKEAVAGLGVVGLMPLIACGGPNEERTVSEKPHPIWDAKNSAEAKKAAKGDEGLFKQWALHHILRGLTEGLGPDYGGKVLHEKSPVDTATFDICRRPPCPLDDLFAAV